MGQTIDSLQIEISSSATSANSALEALTSTLGKLKQATASCAGLETFSKKLRDLGSSALMVNSSTVNSLDNLVAVLTKFANLGTVKFPGQLGEKIKAFVQSTKDIPYSYDGVSNLGKALQNFSGLSDVKIPADIATGIKAIINAASEINDEKIVSIGLLATYLEQFRSVQDITIPRSLGSGLSSLATALLQLDASKFGAISQLATSLNALRSVQGITISSSIGNQILNIAIAIEQLGTVNMSALNDLVAAMQPLSTLGDMTNFAAALKELAKLPSIITKLDAATLDSFAQGIQQLADALNPLITQLNAMAAGFTALPSSLKSTINALQSLPTATNNAKKSSTDLLSSIKLLIGGFKSIVTPISKMIDKSNKYVETLNLFNASLGGYVEQAQKYAESVSEIVGIDPSEWMEAQGIFYNLADGFGIASDRAYIMSQQLTQLSYDLASFYNISVNDAMLKLRGSISGEIEMMRQLGVDLSNGAMQERATAMGIQTKVTAMTQAEKAQLRYLIIMERTTTAQTDMARTLNAPANQLRVLSAQVTQAARAIGNIFIPILNKVIPYAIAVAKAIRFLATSVATLFGFSLPEVSYSSELSSAASSAGELSDNLGSAGGNAKKLKNALMGFDEINRLPDDSSGGGGGGGSGGASLDSFDWELPTYNFLDGLVTNAADSIYNKLAPAVEWISDHLETIAPIATGILGSFLSWKIASGLIPDLLAASATIGTIKGLLAGLAVVIINVVLTYRLGEKFNETGNLAFAAADVIATGLNSLLAGKIAGKVFPKSGNAGLYAASANLAISAIMSLVVLWNGITEDNSSTPFTYKNIVTSIIAIAKGATAGALLGKAIGVGALAGGGVGALITLGAALTIILVKTSFEQSRVSKAILWGQIALTAAEIKTFVQSLLDIDVTTTVTILSGAIENAESAKTELNTTLATFNALINPLEIGVDISEADKTALLTYLDPANETGLLTQLQGKLDTSTLLIKTAIDYVQPVNENGEDQSGSMLTSLLTIDSTISEAAAACGAQLSKLITDGFQEGLESQYQEQVVNLTSWLNRIANGVDNAEAIAKFKLSTSELLENLDKESFEGVLAEYIAQADVLEQSLREAYEASRLEYATKIEQLHNVEEYYRENGMGDLADEVAAQIAAAEEVLANWDVEASVQAAMKGYTSEGYTSMGEALAKIIAGGEKSQSLLDVLTFEGGAFEEIKPYGLEPGEQYNLSEWGVSVEDYAKNLNEWLRRDFEYVFDDDEMEIMVDMADKAGWNLMNFAPTDVQKEFIKQMHETLGSDQMFEVFEEMGYEITPDVLEIFEELGIEIPDALKEGIEDGEDSVTTGVKDVISNAKDLFNNSNIGKTVKGFWGKLTSGTKGKLTTTSEVTLTFKKGKGSKIVPEPSQEVEYIVNLKKGWKEKNLATWVSPTWRKTLTVDLSKGTSVSWNGSLKDLAGKTKLFDISLKKNGGYVRNGEMFIANEAGAEMVGRIGRKSAVANESQIGDAIFKYMDAHGNGDGVNEESLARAIVSGLKQAGIGSVYLNGKDMADAINAETKRTGRPAIVF